MIVIVSMSVNVCNLVSCTHLHLMSIAFSMYLIPYVVGRWVGGCFTWIVSLYKGILIQVFTYHVFQVINVYYIHIYTFNMNFILPVLFSSF